MSKGSTQRPTDKKRFNTNFEKIFGDKLPQHQSRPKIERDFNLDLKFGDKLPQEDLIDRMIASHRKEMTRAFEDLMINGAAIIRCQIIDNEIVWKVIDPEQLDWPENEKALPE